MDPPVILVNDHITSTLEDREDVDLLQPPRVVQLTTNGLQDSDSSRSVQIAAATITIKEAKFNVHDPPIEQIDHLDAQMEQSANKNKEDKQASTAKQTELLIADTQLQVPPGDNKTLPAAAIPRTPTKGSGRKLPTIPGSRSNTASTLTSKASPPLQQSTPSPSHLPTTPTPHSSNEPSKLNVEVVSAASSLVPRPPPNPPPANYTANVLARRRRFIRSQPK